jgi:CheY-like chemotaxis protein
MKLLSMQTRSHASTLILMDIRLPYEDGYGALKKIRASDHLNSIPIVAVTAEASDEQIAKARTAGFRWFFRQTARSRSVSRANTSNLER